MGGFSNNSIFMQYNKKKHLELLKSFPNLKEFIDSKGTEKCLELRIYSLLMVSHFHWENREQYIELIEKLLNGPIYFEELRERYEAIDTAVKTLEAKLILFEPNPKSEGFPYLMEDLLSLSEVYCHEPEFCESFEFNEKELKVLIQNILIEMKTRYP